jgi:hypothetical protein
MSNTDEAEAKLRAEWLHRHKAPKNWIILTGSEVSTIRAELEATERERDEAIRQIENLKAVSIHTCHDQCQRPMCVLRRERDEWAAMCGRYKQERDEAREDAEHWQELYKIVSPY